MRKPRDNYFCFRMKHINQTCLSTMARTMDDFLWLSVLSMIFSLIKEQRVFTLKDGHATTNWALKVSVIVVFGMFITPGYLNAMSLDVTKCYRRCYCCKQLWILLAHAVRFLFSPPMPWFVCADFTLFSCAVDMLAHIFYARKTAEDVEIGLRELALHAYYYQFLCKICVIPATLCCICEHWI